MIPRSLIGTLSAVRAVALVAGVVFATARPADATSDDDWTLCMAATTPPAATVQHCARVLQRPDISPFQRSLLLGSEGDGFHRLHQERQAILSYTQALKLQPSDELDLTGRGQAEEALGRWSDAKKDYDAAISRHGADPANRSNGSADVAADEYALRGRVLLAMHRPREALHDFQMALRLYPEGATPELKALAARARMLAKT